uniref:GIY-YIG homing endonuclease n=1 Tax=Ophiostoma novo-ulmi subsp. novo-ulmi TaxID=170179 RepID=A0A2L1IPW8_OPHNO|nr:GIY-YIG homing endonuclease [Ophiostoma novo-ulmi subsp. novo-ulmi]
MHSFDQLRISNLLLLDFKLDFRYNNPYVITKTFRLNQSCGIINYNFKRTMSTLPKIVPVKFYLNSDKEKELIIKDNKNRAGIYRWTHIESGKSYIGSSKNLSMRLKQYFNYNHISYPKRNLRIYKALLKYGYSSFNFEILEYCDTSVLLKREQYYFDTLNPEYNILKVAGSPLGYRHSEAAKNLIGLSAKGRNVSELTRDLNRKALTGRTLSKDQLDKMSKGNTFSKSILITNSKTGDSLEFRSMTEAGLYLGVSRITIRNYILKGKPIKDYEIKDLSSLKGIDSTNKSFPQQPILLINNQTGDRKELSSIKEAADYLGVSKGSLWYFFKTTNLSDITQKTLKGYTISKITTDIVKSNRNTKNIEITDLITNKVNVYSSFTLAAKAIDTTSSSISGYFKNKRTTPFKKRYILKLI